MMWAAISNDKTDLVHVPGNLTAVRYRGEILRPVRYLMHVIDRQRELFQQDNARPHTARVTMDYLEQNNINVLPWPSKSLDFNPIEHLWNLLDKRVRQRQPPPQTLDQLRQMLQQEWRTIPRNNVRNLIESMPRGDAQQCWPRVVVIHGINFNVTGSVLNCDKLTFYLSSEVWTFHFSIINIESISKSVTENF